jgi:hypothetical protein
MEVMSHKKPIFYDMSKAFSLKMTNLCDKLQTIPISDLRVVEYVCNDQSFFSPTDAQFHIPKNNFKFTLKLTLKGSFMFRYEKRHPQGAHCLGLAEVTIAKMS